MKSIPTKAFARDVYSFWQPLDSKFVEMLVGLSRRANAEFCSLFWMKYLYNYIDYNDRTRNLAPQQLINRSEEAAADYGALVAGNLSNTWEYDPEVSNSAKAVRAIFDEQVGWAVQENADFVIAETFSHLGEARLALKSIQAGGLPAVITFSPATGASCDGYEWEDACKILQDEGADVVGLNCGNGPATMLPFLEKIRQKTGGQLAGLPVPYRTTEQQPCFQKLSLPESSTSFPVSLEPFLLTRYEMADFATSARDMGINYIGICCGAGPHHVHGRSAGSQDPGQQIFTRHEPASGVRR
ncbi:homocysteine S-methyltransferase family protein [Thermodesulfobacteriota bacterium]